MRSRPPAGFGRERQLAAIDVFVRPVLAELARRGTPFRGVLFTGLMLTDAGARLIEYNVRLGDPEAQCLLPLLETDLAVALLACAAGRLGTAAWRLADAASVAIVLAAPGYPDAAVTGETIGRLDVAQVDGVPVDGVHVDGVHVFHAGTRAAADGTIVSAGGRVLTVQARGHDLAGARRAAYEAVSRIDWPSAVFRRDIGLRSLASSLGA